MTTSTGKSAPLEIPTLVGQAQTLRAATATVLVMPVEVYSTGVLVRVRAQLSELPDELADNPGYALVAMPGHERAALSVSTAGNTTAGARSVSSASGRSDGPRRWDVEFWLPRVAFDEAPLNIRWPVVGLDAQLPDLTTDRLTAAADTAQPVR
ncbi:MAG: hypothetical protein L0I76_37595 [Pseudonocardia sp.]|nr:hypothetical protein [Pseudonocardia sp.]